jgi:hypothetical protein
LLFSGNGRNLVNMKRAAFRFGNADLPRLGRHLCGLRRACGHTRAGRAALSGLAESAVEVGRSSRSLPTNFAFFATLGVSIDQIVQAAAAPQGPVAITRAGKPEIDLSLDIVEPALGASARSLPQGQRRNTQPEAVKLGGAVLATTVRGDPLRVEAADTCYPRDAAVGFVAGPGAEPAQLLWVADPRSRMERE